VAQPADPDHTADADQAADTEDDGTPPRGDPWDTFRFRRLGGLERTPTPLTPEQGIVE
jgi:hypothetical protein